MSKFVLDLDHINLWYAFHKISMENVGANTFPLNVGLYVIYISNGITPQTNSTANDNDYSILARYCWD